MSPLLEKIFHEVDGLSTADQLNLYRRLRARFEVDEDDEDQDEIEAAWDEEIASRVKDIEEGRVELISGEEADRRTEALMTRLGLSRSARSA